MRNQLFRTLFSVSKIQVFKANAETIIITLVSFKTIHLNLDRPFDSNSKRYPTSNWVPFQTRQNNLSFIVNLV